MSGRSLWFALTRPGVWIPLAGGAALAIGGVTVVGGIILGIIGAARFKHVLSHSDLDQRLQLKACKREQRIERMLTEGERQEIVELDLYSNALRQFGADRKLGERVMGEAWRILREDPANQTVEGLKRLRHDLPPLHAHAAAEPDSDVGQQIQQELDLLRVTQKEVEQVS